MPIDAHEKQNIVKKLMAGASFRLSGFILIRALQVVRLSIFARLFTPDIIGTAALATSSVAIMTILANWGFVKNFIRNRDESTSFADTVYTLSWLFGVVVFCLTLLVAPIFSRIFSATLNQYIWFLSFLVFTVPIQFPNAFWEKQLEFGHPTVVLLVQALSNLIITVGLQVAFDLGIWSLLIGQVGGFALSGLYIWLFADYRPRFRIERNYVRPIMEFGGPLMVQDMNGQMMSRGDNLMVGAFAGPTQLAYYNFAWQLPTMIGTMTHTVDSMLYPIFSRLSNDERALTRIFNLASQMWSIVGSFLGFFVILYAELIVQILYGPQWGPVTPILRIMTLSFVVRYCTGYGYDNLVLVRGRTRYMMNWGFANTMLIFTIGMLMIRTLGPIGGALFWLLQALVVIPLLRFPLIHQELHTLTFLRRVWQPVLSGLLAGLPAYYILINNVVEPELLSIAGSMIIYVVTYVMTLLVLDRGIIPDINRFVALAKG